MVNHYSLIISAEMNIMRKHVSATLRMLDEGATVPFIARYRKEATGSLDEVAVHKITQRYQELQEFFKRRDFVAESIRQQGAMTPELEQRIEETFDPLVLEDIYMPYKPKRHTRAEAAREAGLEPLAKIIMAQNANDIVKTATKYVNNDTVKSAEEAIAGAQDIIAEWVSESEKARNVVRSKYQRSATVVSKVAKGMADNKDAQNYQNYFDFSEPARLCPSHRYLAMRRGEAEGFLNVSISIDDDEMIDRLSRMFVRSTATEECATLVRAAVKDGYRRLMRPSIENEAASQLKDRSDAVAIALFADNARQLLMGSPSGPRRILAIDPGFASGCKLVALDEHGDLLDNNVIYPHPHQKQPTRHEQDLYHQAIDIVIGMIDYFGLDTIVIGDGTASQQTLNFVSRLTYPHPIDIQVVSEQGASIYSASEVAREEFPDYDITVRGAVSIGRRFLDPLAEYVKIDPKSIGVGQYQHDVNQTKLQEALDFTVESCVNQVGVNVNTASKQLLSYVSGIGKQLASNIVEYRREHGDFANREALRNVPRLGEKTYQQCAGFLRVPGSDNPLDNTGVHPERYSLVEAIAAESGADVAKLVSDRNFLHNIDIEKFVTKEAGLPTLTDIVLELEKPGRDPRIKEVAPIVLAEKVSSINDLYPEQILTGKVNNITAFGVFVDLGLKENGLIHISQLSDGFVKSPSDIVSVGDVLRVKVMSVDAMRGRIALTLKGVDQ